LYQATNEFIKALEVNTQKLTETFNGATTNLATSFSASVDHVSKSLPAETNRIEEVVAGFGANLNRALAVTLDAMQMIPITIKQTTERIDIQHSELLVRNMKSFQKSADSFLTILQNNNSQIVMLGTSVDQLQKRLDEIKASPDLLAKHVGDIFSIYANAANQSANIFDQSATLFQTSLSSYTESLEKLSERTAQLSSLSNRGDAEIKIGERLTVSFEKLSIRLDTLTEKIASLDAKLIDSSPRPFWSRR
jgi:hypothetical protein